MSYIWNLRRMYIVYMQWTHINAYKNDDNNNNNDDRNNNNDDDDDDGDDDNDNGDDNDVDGNADDNFNHDYPYHPHRHFDGNDICDSKTGMCQIRIAFLYC